MFIAFVYSCLRLLLDVVDVMLRVHEPEAEGAIPDPRSRRQIRWRL